MTCVQLTYTALLATLGLATGCDRSYVEDLADSPLQTESETAAAAAASGAESAAGNEGLTADLMTVGGMAVPASARIDGRHGATRHYTIDAPYDQLVRFYRDHLPNGTEVQRFERGTRFRLEDGRSIYLYRESESEPYALTYFPGDWESDRTTAAGGVQDTSEHSTGRSPSRAPVNMAELERQASSAGGSLPPDHPHAGAIRPGPDSVSEETWGRPRGSTAGGRAEAPAGPAPAPTENPYELERHLGRHVSTGSMNDPPGTVSFSTASGSSNSTGGGSQTTGLPRSGDLDFVRGVVEHPTNPDALF